MSYEEVVKKAKQAAKKLDTKEIGEHIAVQFDIVGDGEGAFYVEINDGKVAVEPYEYYDNDGKVIAGADTILAFLSGELNAEDALAQGTVTVEGDGSKVMMLAGAAKTKPEKKAVTTKKSAPKKTTKKK